MDKELTSPKKKEENLKKENTKLVHGNQNLKAKANEADKKSKKMEQVAQEAHAQMQAQLDHCLSTVLGVMLMISNHINTRQSELFRNWS